MSYRLQKASIRREVHRVARRQLKRASKKVLGGPEEKRSEAVHEARMHIKKVRALVRLLRPALGVAFYKREDRALCKAAERMSAVRDAEVRLQTLKKLMARSPGHRAALGRIHAHVLAHCQPALEKSEHGKWCKHVAADIQCATRRVHDWPLERLKPRSLRAGLKSAYRHARCSLANARNEATDANLHELRKHIKDLWYDLQLLRGDSPRVIETLTGRMRDLGERLGDDHDLAMLLAAGGEEPAPNRSDWKLLEQLIAARRRRGQRAALHLAAEVLNRKPGAFADLVFDRWVEWRARE
jgi:CHAD domain-containing protein